MRKFTPRTYTLSAAALLSAAIYLPINQSASGGFNLSSTLEQHIPLIPVFAIPYLLFLPLFWATSLYALNKNKDFFRLVNVMIIVFTLSNIFYLLVSTYAPRPKEVTGWLHGLVSYIYSHDKPYCDLPSEHVSMAIIFGLYWWSNSKKYRWYAVAFSISVILATVFIKQHSVIGAIAGMGLGAGVWFVVSKYMSGIQLD